MATEREEVSFPDHAVTKVRLDLGRCRDRLRAGPYRGAIGGSRVNQGGRHVSPTIEQIDDHGYIATFTGRLTLEQIAAVRGRAAELFAPDALRWAVMDLRDAEVSNPIGPEEELDQIAKLHTVARDIKDVRTNALRLALVADENRFGTLVEIMVTATRHLTRPRVDLELEIERFDGLDEAVSWGQAFSHSGTHPD